MSATCPRARAWPLGLPAVVLASIGQTACGTGVSTSGFTGEKKAVAQRISDFKRDATAAEEQKVCQNDLAGAVRAQLKTAGSDCQTALKSQLGQIDTLELTIASIQVNGDTASAQVKSTWSGKTRASTLRLLKEGGAWRIAGLR